MRVVELEGLSTGYGPQEILSGISLSLEQGELLVVLGMNGSGKSTLLKAMAGLIPPWSGTVRLFGVPPSKKTRSRIGAAFDEPAHWDVLSGWENAYFFARSYGLDEAEAEARVAELLRWSGLWGKRAEPAGTYSYGMRRKLALVEALAHRPELLFLDEPSMGLDHISRIALYHALREMTGSGRSVVVTTNDLQEASVLADRVCVLNKGRVAAVALPQELVDQINQAVHVFVRLASPIDPSLLAGIGGVGEPVRGNDPSTVILPVSGSKTRVEDALVRIMERMAATGAEVREIKVDRPDLGQVLMRMGGPADETP